MIHILTHVPRQVSAQQVAELYRKRWTLETAFKHLEAYFHSAINTLGYPKAALFGFCLALVAYNLLAVVLAALRRVHGEEMVDEEVSLYYIANEITTTYHGMMIAIPEPEWDVFYAMSTADLAAILVELAQGVRLQAFRKSPRRPKKPHPQGKKPARKGHVSTFQQEHSVILTLLVGAADTARIPDRTCRYTWRSEAPTSHCCWPRTTRLQSA
jgi:hypothetical protein